MKISLPWIKDYIPFPFSDEELAERLTMAGLEIEGVEQVAGQTVFELEITPNRPDCLNLLGLAREISAICNKPVKTPPIVSHRTTKNKLDITIENAQECGRYIGTLIADVKIAPTPHDMTQKLAALGSQSINNAVDITNFCMFEFGQPLHVFDYDKLEGGRLIIRRAKKGESIVTLDDVTRELDPSILVIADARKPVAIAGIMGSKVTGVTESTKKVLLESAYFDLGMIRQASRKLGLSSDSCYRFERGVVYEHVQTSADRATDLLVALTGGRVTARTDVRPVKFSRRKNTVSLTEQDLESLLGSRVPLRQAKTILNRLGFEVADGKSSLKVTAPYWRGDIHIKEDLIEEVARIIGYDRLPMTLPHIRISDASLDTSAGDAADEIRSVLNAQGYDEVITYALVNKDDLTKVGFAEPRPLAIQNPLSQDQDVLRTTLLPSLLTVAATNINRGQRDIKIFEIGKTYFIEGEKRTLALLATGQAEVDWRVGSKRAVDFYDLKGAVAATLQRVGMNSCEYRSEKSAGFAEGETAVIYSGRKRVGVVGAVDEAVRKAWNIKHGDVYFAQVDLDALSGDEPAEKKLADISGYPPATRDVSLAVPEGITYAQIESVCWKEGRPLLISVQFIEQYLGEKMEKGFRGLVFSLTYQSSERTLREDEVNQLHENICRSLSEQFGVVRR